MPVISRFYGIVIKMFFFSSEHNPPHIHVIYGEYVGIINIQTLEMIQGDLPNKAYNLAKEWMSLHQNELLEMWKTQDIHALPPIE